jgi:hypothetical protein
MVYFSSVEIFETVAAQRFHRFLWEKLNVTHKDNLSTKRKRRVSAGTERKRGTKTTPEFATQT